MAKPADGDGRMRQFRLDRISTAAIEARFFLKDFEFDLAEHSARAFGSYHSETEYGEVIWRFRPNRC